MYEAEKESETRFGGEDNNLTHQRINLGQQTDNSGHNSKRGG